MKKFNFKYSPLLWFLLTVVFGLSVAGGIWNVYNAVYYAPFNSAWTAIYSIIACISFSVTVLDVSMIFYGCYTVKNEYLYSNFGLIKSKSKIKDIIEITHFKKSDKLVVYYKEGTFSVIMIDSKFYDDFILELRKVNPEIVFDNRIEGEDTPLN